MGNGVEYPAELKPLSHLGTASRIDSTASIASAAQKLIVLSSGTNSRANSGVQAQLVLCQDRVCLAFHSLRFFLTFLSPEFSQWKSEQGSSDIACTLEERLFHSLEKKLKLKKFLMFSFSMQKWLQHVARCF